MMEDEEKYYCDQCGKVEIPKPQYCCNSFDCGCMGMPIEPPFCSEKCYNDYMLEKRNKTREDNIIIKFEDV